MYKDWFEKIRNEEIILSEIENETEINQYIECIYYVFLSYLGLEEYKINSYLNYFMEDCFDLEGKENNEIIRNIREDVLRGFRKEMNYCYWEDRDMD